MAVDPLVTCSTPPSTCFRPDLQSPAMQQWLLLQLLNGLLNTPLSLDDIKTAAQGWICQGSPSSIQLLMAQEIVDGLAEVNTDQPVCWTPLELSGGLAYLVCVLLSQISEPV